MSREWRHDGYIISTDTSRLDLGMVHSFLKSSYWAAGVPFEVVERSVQNSMVFGVYRGAEQTGFARVVTDRATFAYLADVFVLETHRGRGLGKWLIETILSHPDLQGLRRWMLATRDAHELYREHDFDSLQTPEIFMERRLLRRLNRHRYLPCSPRCSPSQDPSGNREDEEPDFR
jgi:GNAT superfamily N-acetyltransferase